MGYKVGAGIASKSIEIKIVVSSINDFTNVFISVTIENEMLSGMKGEQLMTTYQKLVLKLLTTILWRLVNVNVVHALYSPEKDQKHRELIEESKEFSKQEIF